ncbi:MAG: ABC transporter ATP-binding protein [Egibacteraceae bacterium]
MDASLVGQSPACCVSVRGLGYRYPGARAHAVAQLTFDVRKGEIFGLLGPSGAGKSTTQKLLTGLLRGYAGAIEVFGRPLPAWGSSYYEHIGVSFELPAAYRKLTATENLAFFAALYERPSLPTNALLDRLGLADVADERTGTFSKGMHVRLNLARALLHEPELLFLDEPTAGLDPSNVRLVTELLVEQRTAGRTVLLATHDMAVAQAVCDRVAFVVGGRIALVDAPRVLRQRYGTRTVQVGYRSDDRLLHREFALDGLVDDQDFTRLLRSGVVETLHSREAELADVYVRIAAQRAERDDAHAAGDESASHGSASIGG